MRADKDTLIEHIIKRIAAGDGIVPFVGAGISAPSGLLTGIPYLNYINRALLSCLKEGKDLRSLGWPSLSSPDSYVEIMPREYLDLTGASTNGNDAIRLDHPFFLHRTLGDPEQKAREEKVRLLRKAFAVRHDWRQALHMIACLKLENHAGNLILRECRHDPDQTVIDSFNTHITRGARPSLIHRMIAHLSYPLRITTILSTNFDTLVEDAFREQGEVLDPYSVHLSGGIPPAHLLDHATSIVKIHGSLFGTRSNDSLDGAPSTADVDAFATYVCPGKGAERLSRPKSNLLVMGLSGERRPLDLVKGALERALKQADTAFVYWLVYPGSRAEDEIALVEDHINSENLISCTTKADVFLLELYQRLTHSLPAGGGYIPMSHLAPPAPAPAPSASTIPMYGFGARLWKDFKKNLRTVTIVTGEPGITSELAGAFDRALADGHNALYFDMDMFAGPSDLFATMVEAMARASGIGESGAFVPSLRPSNISTLLTHANVVNRPWVVFLNGRSGPGVNAGWGATWSDADYKAMWTYIESIGNLAPMHIRLIYAPLCADRVDTLKGRWEPDGVSGFRRFRGASKDLPEFAPDTHIPSSILIQPFPHKKRSAERAEVIKDKAIEWARNGNADGAFDKDKLAFLLSISEFRRERHVAALCSWGVQIMDPSRQEDDRDRFRGDRAHNWIGTLERYGLMRLKDGGYAWMHTDIKEALVRELRGSLIRQEGLQSVNRLYTRIHAGISEWYMKAFRASGDTDMVIESIYHRGAEIHFAREAGFGEPAIGRARCEAANALHTSKKELVKSGRRDKCAMLRQLWEQGPQKGNALGYIFGDNVLKVAYDCLYRLNSETGRIGSNYRSTEPKSSQDDITPKSSQKPTEQTSLQGTSHEIDATTVPRLFVHILSTYRKGTAESFLRCYDAAEVSYGEVAQSLGSPIQELYTRLNNPQPVTDREMGHLVDAAVESWSPSDIEPARLTSQVVRRAMYVWLQRGITCSTISAFAPSEHDNSLKQLHAWQISESFARAGMRLIRSIHEGSDTFQSGMAARLYSQYALALAHLPGQRYFEANRRIDEACAFLRKTWSGGDPTQWAVIHIRRAEIRLAEAHARALSKPDELLTETLLSLLGDADRSLNRALSTLSGDSKALWWWRIAFRLKLLICETRIKLAPESGSRQTGFAAQYLQSVCAYAPYEPLHTAQAILSATRIRDSLSPAESDPLRRMCEDAKSVLTAGLRDHVLQGPRAELLAGDRRTFLEAASLEGLMTEAETLQIDSDVIRIIRRAHDS